MEEKGNVRHGPRDKGFIYYPLTNSGFSLVEFKL